MIERIGENYRADWCTPQNIIDRLNRMGGVGLDPCSSPQSIVRAAWAWNEADDGLSKSWHGHLRGEGLVYVNPPYAKGARPWTDKMVLEAREGAEIVALLPARTDTKWFQNVWTADILCFIRGRLTFLGAESPAQFPSVVAYWGRRKGEFVNAFSDLGHIILL